MSEAATDRITLLKGFERADLKLPAIEPMVVNAPVQLPPLSEALFNPALVERTVGPHPLVAGGAHMSESDTSYTSYAAWPVSSLG